MNFKTILKSFKNKDMLKRILTVIGILVAYRILAHVPVPLGDNATFKDAVNNLINGTDFGGFINHMFIFFRNPYLRLMPLTLSSSLLISGR